MNNILNIKTPAENEAGVFKSDYGLDRHGLTNLRKVYWNLPPEALYEEIIFRGEGKITRDGSITVLSGKHTARAWQDKFIVREPSSEENVWWGEYNRPYSTEKFNELVDRLQGFFQGRDVFVQDCYIGSDPKYRMPVRIISEWAWHSLFVRNMFILPQSQEEYRRHVPEFTLIAAPSFKASQPVDQTRTTTFIVLNFDQKLCIVGDSGYSGEIKKSIFTVMNYYLPLKGVMTMHCSANKGDDENDVGLFFGLSGTGKTTLSNTTERYLIGDDEHGWSDDGVFNFEGGCYAKVIQLSPTAEPLIYASTRRFGTLLENVIFDPATRYVDLDDDAITENTRASYPLEFIDNALPEKRGGHPRNIFLLTCDAQGVMPPIAKLTPEQAVYHFLSGYTSKVGGTEVGLGEEPEITFSTCYGAVFMVHHPTFYGDLFKRKIERYGVNCWVLNTGWVGGGYWTGRRISISYTRAILSAALRGGLDHVEYREDPIFGFMVPTHCEGVPDEIFDPASSWSSREEHHNKYMQLAARFRENFKRFEKYCEPAILEAGPRLERKFV